MQPEKLQAWIEKIKPDAVFCICFPFLIPQSILELVPGRFINFHTGPLPEYRGPMPIFEVLRSLEKETALSVHLMDKKFDEGALIIREPVQIDKGETFGSLALKLSDRTSIAALNIAQMLEYGTSVPTTEQASMQARYHPKPGATDTLIRWEHMHAEQIVGLINSCNPWNTGAEAQLNNKTLKIISAGFADEEHGKQPGTILRKNEDGSLEIACVEDQKLIAYIIFDERGINRAGTFIKDEKIKKNLHANSNTEPVLY